MPMILILRPLEWFGIVGAELKRVSSLSQYMMVEGTVISDHIGADQKDLHELAMLCEQLRPASLYAKYANQKVFRHEKDFWATKDTTVRSHVKRMADKSVIKAVGLADLLDIPILYCDDKKSPLRISEQLKLESGREVTPVMNFHRHSEGTTYQLQLRIDGSLVEKPSEHHLIVLTHEPGMFVIDRCICFLCNGFSGKLLLPFTGKQQVEIPRKMENDYFHRFIMKHVAQAEVNAEGFDITDISIQPRACLTAETAINGSHLLILRFRYGNLEYTPDAMSSGKVMLTEEQGSFRFVRQLRNKDIERQLTECLKEFLPKQPSSSNLTKGTNMIKFPSLEKMIEWLREYAPRLKELGFDVVQPSEHIYYIGPLNVEQNDTWNGDWLQTDVTVVVEGDGKDQPPGQLRIPFLDLRDTILRGEQEYMLPTGELLLIPQEWLKRYSDLLLIGMKKGQGFQRHRSQLQKEEAIDTLQDKGDTLHDYSAPPPPSLLRATLRPYQQTGFQWLWKNFVAQTGCCLSDEMGLGKTLQTIALLLRYKEVAQSRQTALQPLPGMLFSDDEMRGSTQEACTEGSFHLPYYTSLVVAPASVVHNWRNELSRFAPSLTVLTYTGNTAQRKDKRLAIMRWDIVITTYRTLLNDIEQLSKNEFGIIVFDESQAFKTPTSLIHQAVCRLRSLHCLALSGTPVENNLQELWSLMNVLNPHLLGSARSFQNTFINPIAKQMEDSRRELLRRLIAPYFLKRTKEEVLEDLPERQDEIIVCPMTDEQASHYSEELSKARNEWLDPHANSNNKQIHILAALQRLRQIANGEGKLNVVFDHLENLRQTQHKVLIFSEYVTLLERVGTEMTSRGWTYAMLTGQTKQREEVIARFQVLSQREQIQTSLNAAESRQDSTQGQQSADCQFFLISLKAGGVGLNLTAADYVFLLDPWWNHAAEEQAIARAHRIGQKRSIFVYRFVSSGTLEEQILTLQDRKQSLIDSVMPFICNPS